MPPSAVVAGAAPVWVGERLDGPQHCGTVVHVGADAVYVDSGSDVIGVVSRHATPIPCTITTRAESVETLLTGHRPAVGDEVSIGAGVVDFGHHRVRVARYVDFAMRRLDRAQAPLMAERLVAACAGTEPPGELAPELLALLRDQPVEALDRVLGRGSGLTPFGDDVVCGLLATLLAADDPCAADLRREVLARAPRRTTSLSSTLLRRAGAGDVLPAFADVVGALVHRPEAVGARVSRLRAVGHTSGAGMLLGLHLALDHINTRSCP